MRTRVYVSFDFKAVHHWPEAPDGVKFLAYPHRHLFKCKATFSIESDRQVEFLMAQRDSILIVQTKLLPKLQEDMTMSCEHMALFIITELAKVYPVSSVEVSEDGENGAIVFID